ncbi:MAG: serine hydrolase domain-containing protein [Pseudomonadota bacterium]
MIYLTNAAVSPMTSHHIALIRPLFRQALIYTAATVLVLSSAASIAALPDDLIAELQETLSRDMTEAIDAKLIAGGSAIIVTADQVLLRKGYGHADLTTRKVFSPDSPVVLASVTKPIVATAAARAVSLGLISFDDRVDIYLPAFRSVTLRAGGDPLSAPTIAQLLSHTGGVLGNTQRNAWLRELTNRARTAGEPAPESINEVVVSALATDGFRYPPGSEFRYSGLGFNIVAMILQQVTETDDYQTAIDTLLFAPLGRETLTFRPDATLIANMPMRYNLRNGELQPAGRINPRPRFGYINAGGSLVGSLDDLASIVQLHLNHGKHGGKRLIRKKVLKALYVRQPNARDRGMGFRVGEPGDDGAGAYLRHGGASGTILWFDLDTGLGGAILTQTPARQTRGLALRMQVELLNVARRMMGFEPVASANAREASN